MNVLIADDSALFRTRLVSVVTELGGFEVVSEAGSAPDGLTFVWALGGVEGSTGATQAYTLEDPGTYVVTVTAFASDGSIAFTLSLEIEIPRVIL